jgi:hypothetical protein
MVCVNSDDSTLKEGLELFESFNDRKKLFRDGGIITLGSGMLATREGYRDLILLDCGPKLKVGGIRVDIKRLVGVRILKETLLSNDGLDLIQR